MKWIKMLNTFGSFNLAFIGFFGYFLQFESYYQLSIITALLLTLFLYKFNSFQSFNIKAKKGMEKYQNILLFFERKPVLIGEAIIIVSFNFINYLSF